MWYHIGTESLKRTGKISHLSMDNVSSCFHLSGQQSPLGSQHLIYIQAACSKFVHQSKICTHFHLFSHRPKLGCNKELMKTKKNREYMNIGSTCLIFQNTFAFSQGIILIKNYPVETQKHSGILGRLILYW